MCEDELRSLSTRFVNEILSDVAELISDDWETNPNEEEEEND